MSNIGTIGSIICTNLIDGVSCTDTNNDTLVLSPHSSTKTHVFTGNSTHIVTLPQASSCALGLKYMFINNSTDNITINTYENINVTTLAPSSSIELTCLSHTSSAPTSWLDHPSGGSVKNVRTGTGLTGGPITSTGIVSLANTAVTPGSYTRANLTVDQQGRITAASSGTAVTSVSSGTGLTGGPITSTGTLSLANTAVTPGSYTLSSLTVDQQGRITAATSGTAVTSVSSGTGLTGGPITSTGTLSLSDTAVTPGSYTITNLTVDQKGRITAATNGTAVTSVSSGTGLAGGPITTTGTLSLANTTVTPGSYTLSSLTVDQQGRITAAANGTAVTSITSGTGLTGGTITSTGTVALADTAVTPGSYTLSSLTVDQQGRITAASSGTAVTSVSAGTGLTGGPITTTGTLSLANTAVTAGSYYWPYLTVDQQGRLTACSSDIVYASVSLTATQWKALNGTPVTLLAAPTSGYYYEWISGGAEFTYSSTSPSGTNYLYVRPTGASSNSYTARIYAPFVGYTANGICPFEQLVPSNASGYGGLTATLYALGWELWSNANFGTVTNGSFRIKFTYRIRQFG